jgi:hypothetical protein
MSTKTMPDLSHCTGTEGYHKLTFMSRLLCTDGVKLVADQCGAYWLVDLVASHLPNVVRKLGRDGWLYFCYLTVKDGKAVVEFKRDVGKQHKALARQEIEYTDFPEGEHTFYIQSMDEENRMYCMMVPQEY